MASEYKQCDCGNGFTTTTGASICPACRTASNLDTPSRRRKLREQNAPGSHTAKQWFARIDFQNALCFWCFKTMLNPHGTFCGTKDHLVPLSRGGSHYIENIVAACYACNRHKGTKTATEYQSFLLQQRATISEVSALPASTWLAFSPPGMRLSTAPLEVREAIFSISHGKAMEVRARDMRPRRELLKHQAAEIRRHQLVEAGQLTLPMFGPSESRKLMETEPQTLAVSKGLHIVDANRRQA